MGNVKMKLRIISLMIVILMTSGFQSESCSSTPVGDKVHIGPEAKADLVFFFKIGVSPNEINEFQRTVTGLPGKSGTGHSSLPGVMSEVMFYKGEYRGEALRFKLNASEEERTFVKSRIQGSPLIFRVYENVVPNEITDIPASEKAEPLASPSRIPPRQPSKVVIPGE